MRKYFCKHYKVIALLNDCYTGKPRAYLLAHPIEIDNFVTNVELREEVEINTTKEWVNLYLIKIRFLQLRICTQSCEHCFVIVYTPFQEQVRQWRNVDSDYYNHHARIQRKNVLKSIYIIQNHEMYQFSYENIWFISSTYQKKLNMLLLSYLLE